MNVAHRCEDYGWHEEGCNAVGEPLDGRTGALCLADHLDDLGEKGIRTDPLSPHDKATRAVHGASGNFGLHVFLDRNWLAADHRLVNRTMSLQHHAIDRNLLARPDPQPSPT